MFGLINFCKKDFQTLHIISKGLRHEYGLTTSMRFNLSERMQYHRTPFEERTRRTFKLGQKRYSTLPDHKLKKLTKKLNKAVEVEEVVEEGDLGAMISVLTKGIQS